ncbi:TPA: IS110 family transposase [Enterococcus faecalis]|uniref:IS110 family transposase n=3 Tax=Enterococcus faecalis TaxID=1351 RepID=UPI0001F0DD2E|nr:IS110 family transposase [Enterococcus faecalis]EFT39549.1 transposase, IS116/IS110/IS902 family [Enterococcus faecalis TX2137]EGO2752306.1 IS110 family transposase [Enterococcus faecalis]EGO6638229.1 IS110 family transposase [Enterococcus faecalis]EGO8618405.1 IS110 family transposase [Enterococcus faecalis]EGO8774578.1 IS110 family transposase [Enterococcus faecalis]
MNYTAAFDVGMGKSYMVLYDEQACILQKWISHSKESFMQLKRLFDVHFYNEFDSLDIVFEATGVYSKPLERFFLTEGYRYSKLNPLEASFQAKTLRRNKNDKADAHSLAKSYMVNKTNFYKSSDKRYDELKQLSRYYSEIDEELSIVRGRLHSCIQATFPELEQLFTTKSHLFLNIVQIYPHPQLILKDSKTIIKNKIIKHTQKNISSSRAQNKAKLLIEAAQNSYPAVDELHPVILQVQHYARRYQELMTQKDEITDLMYTLTKGLPEYAILLSFPGIGVNSAVRIVAELGDIRRFDNSKQINAFVGIDVRRYQSGKFQMRDKINKRGNKKLRKILYLVILNMIRNKSTEKNHIKEYYYKLKADPMNKCHKVAVIAAINKLLRTIFYLVKQDVLYDYEKAITH